MKHEIKVPSMGESITEVTIGKLFSPPGTIVKADTEILELETDKINQSLYAPTSGRLTLNVKTGDRVRVGQAIGEIEETGASGQPAKEIKGPQQPHERTTEPKEVKSASEVEEMKTPLQAKDSKGASQQEEFKSAPQPATIQARKTKEAFIAELKSEERLKEESTTSISPKSSEQRETRRKMTTIRKVIAERMVEAQQSAAMLTTFNEIDMGEVMALREKYKESFLKKYDVKLGLMSFFVKAAASALAAFPNVNSYIDGDEIVHREYYDIGVAIGTDRGVFVPVIRESDQLDFAEIEKQIENFARLARDGKIALKDIQGGGFTITNGGVYGSLLSTPILNPPQCAILGMHKIEKRPVVINDQVVIRPMMYVALSYDHRLIDGKEAVSFLVHIKNALEDPARILLQI